MDLTNNNAGRALVSKCPEGGRSCLQNAAAEALESGELIVWSENSTNSGELVSSDICEVSYE